jgi:hypothetical protein
MKMTKFDPNKSYSIGVWDMTFYVVDENGNPVRNEQGEIAVFHAPNIDYSYMADGLDVDDLEENDDA